MTALATLPIPATGLSQDSLAKLKDTYTPLWEEAQKAVNAAPKDRVTDATDVTGIKKARTARLAIREVRIQTEKTRAEMKQDVLNLTKAIDGPAKIIKDFCEGHEARLQEDEDFAARAEAARKAQLKTERAALLAPFGINTEMMTLGELTKPEFDAFYNTTKAGFEAQQAAAAKAEADRVEAARLKAEEDARVRAENARLKAEADAAAKALAEQKAAAAAEAARVAAERKKAEDEAERLRAAERAKAAAELAEANRKAKEAADAAAKVVADAKAKADAEALAAKKAAAAPDAEKIRAIAAALLAIPMPSVSSEHAERVEGIRQAINSLAARINATANDLTN